MSASIQLFLPIKTKAQAEAICGTLSNPSKMPGHAYSTPATQCKTGAALAKVPGSVCHGCYALKGRYRFPNVIRAMQKRAGSLTHPQWVEAITFLINASDACGYFRWHDSGDVQSVVHLEQICEVARRLPQMKFWLPTREKQIVRQHAAIFGRHPSNLCIRLSAAMVDREAPQGFANTSTVVTAADKATCRAPDRGGVCGTCRACWDPAVANVSYLKH